MTQRIPSTIDQTPTDQSASSGQSSCTTCGQPRAAGSYAQAHVYAVGRIEPRFPSLAIEKEFAQAIARAGTPSLKDTGAVRAVLTRAENAYLLRQLCWVFAIQGLDSYVVTPSASDEARLLESLRPSPQPTDLDVLIGTAGPRTGGRACNGLMLPSVALAQLYSFGVKDFVAHLPRPKTIADNVFTAAVEQVLRLAENPGARSDHRAINYLVTRDPTVHATVAQQAAAGATLASVHVRASSLAGTREIVDVIFGFRHRETNVVEQISARVDVSEVFPFLVAPLGPYVEH